MSIIWQSDLTQANCVLAGYEDDSFQRQNGAGTFNDTTVAWPMVPVSAPGGRAGNALQYTIPSNYRRYETHPVNAQDIATQANSLYFGVPFYTGSGFPAGTNYQVITQWRQSDSTGSPVCAVEWLGGNLMLTGGWGIDTGNQTRLQYTQTIMTGPATQTWYNMVVRIGPWTTSENTATIDVWINGTQYLSNYTLKPATNYAGSTRWKQGIYHDNANAAATIYHAQHTIATTYAEADPTPYTGPSAVPVYSEFARNGMFFAG